MNHPYRDIRSLTKRELLWFDEYAVPRYCKFSPDAINNIYADETALLEIACQGCGRRFKVALSYNIWDRMQDRPTLLQLIRRGVIHYGDPPNVECCPVGAMMNCEDLRVLEFWARDGKRDWKRKKKWERDLK